MSWKCPECGCDDNDDYLIRCFCGYEEQSDSSMQKIDNSTSGTEKETETKDKRESKSAFSNHEPENKTIKEKKEREVINTMNINGITFPLASNMNEFCEIVSERRVCALIFNISDYRETLRNLSENLSNYFGIDSDFFNSISHSIHLCKKCNRDITSSMSSSLLGFGIPACPHCGCKNAFYVYDNLSYGEITQNDIDEIREYWRHCAHEWWEGKQRTEADCDNCDKSINRNNSFLYGNDLICERCCDKSLGGDALQRLKRNPHYFGNHLLRKARYLKKRAKV